MTDLTVRTTRLRFRTSEEIRERGKYRKVVVEGRPGYAILRLEGMRSSFELPWGSIYSLAVKAKVASDRAEKKAAKKK